MIAIYDSYVTYLIRLKIKSHQNHDTILVRRVFCDDDNDNDNKLLVIIRVCLQTLTQNEFRETIDILQKEKLHP